MTQDIPSFDELMKIAKEDPKQLDQLRTQLAHRTIDQAPEHLQPRLRGLQFQIDSKCRLAKTPIAACIQLSNMMHSSFSELYDALHGEIKTFKSSQNNDNISKADILMFP